MDKINPRCAGLDIHKDSVFAAARIDGRQTIVKFGTNTRRVASAWRTGWPSRA